MTMKMRAITELFRLIDISLILFDPDIIYIWA